MGWLGFIPLPTSSQAQLILLLGPAIASAQTQDLSADPAALVVSNGQRFSIAINYDTSDGNAELTGFGARLHWDPSKLRFNGLSDVLDDVGSILDEDTTCQDDTETNYDDDPGTRCYAQVAYVAFYGRPADCPGFRYWADQLVAGKLSDIIQAFGTSAEFDERYGGLTNAQLVDNVYEQMFNRLPDPEGRAFYIRMLQSGQMTLLGR